MLFDRNAEEELRKDRAHSCFQRNRPIMVFDMLIGLNRFMTTEDVEREYRVPASLAAEILPSLPAVPTKEDGSRFHLESEVDDFFAEYVRKKRQAEAQVAPPAHGRAGRKVETLEIALFADKLRREKMHWKEVFIECRKRWPDSDHVKNAEQLRATHRRHIGKLHEKAN